MIIVNRETGRSYSGMRAGVPQWSLSAAVRFPTIAAASAVMARLRGLGFAAVLMTGARPGCGGTG